MLTGLPLGILLWRAERVRRVLQPYLTTYYAIPIFAFYPLFIAVFGLGAVAGVSSPGPGPWWRSCSTR